MNRPKDPIELQALEAFENLKKVNHDFIHLLPINVFIEGYKAAIKANNEPTEQ